MSTRHSFGEIHLDVTAGREQSQAKPDAETPFRIALLGDFSGRANRGWRETGAALASRRPIMIDRDNFDSVLAKMAPRLELGSGGEEGLHISLQFADLDDFHPDRLFERVQIFQKLREVRQRLKDPATFAKTAAELGLTAAGAAREATIETPRDAPPPEVSSLVSGSLLDEMVETTESRPEKGAPRRRDAWAIMLSRIVAPHLVAKADPRQAELVALIEKASGAQMAALLHAADFQALEAAWRAVFFLVRNIETDSHLKLSLIDISKEELAEDLASAGDLGSAGIYKLLVEKTVGTPGAEPWAVIAGNYTFTPGLKDIELLARISQVAASAGAPFLAGASPALLGCESVAELLEPRQWKDRISGQAAALWQSLRHSPEARWIGLALPRFLLRLPYGKETEPAETFQFEEMPDPNAHENYLWGNAAFACALLLAQSFTEQAWKLRPGSVSEIGGLPLYIYFAEAQQEALPCAEVLLTERAAEKMLENGFMPLASLKDQPAVRLIRIQSIGDPLSGLAGRWN